MQNGPQTYVTQPEVARIARDSLKKLKSKMDRAGLLPDGQVTIGRGMCPIYRAERVGELLAVVAPNTPVEIHERQPDGSWRIEIRRAGDVRKE
jgi:hypothetical protein